MAVDTFVVRLLLARRDWTEARGRDLATELVGEFDEGEVLGAWTGFERDALLVTLLVEAADLSGAERAAERLTRAVCARVGEEALLRDGEVGPLPPAVGRLLLASDVDEVVGAFGVELADDRVHPPVRLQRRVRHALGPGQLGRLGDPDGCGVRVRLGRVWTQHEPRPPHPGPWRSRPGPEVGLPRTTELAVLSGVAFEVPEGDAEALTADLARELGGVGWGALCLGAAVEEWRGRAGFRTSLRAASGRALVGLFPSGGPDELVWFHGTTAPEVGVGTDELVRALGHWRERAELVPVRIGPTSLVLRFARLPRAPEAFAAEVLGLCPRARAVEQQGRTGPPSGVPRAESFQSLARDLERTSRLVLDWT